MSISRTLAYLLVEWDNGDGHSVVDCKLATLAGGSAYYTPGTKVVCNLPEGEYEASIICAGS